MEVTRKVILDLLPLYLADEVSDDTRALVEKYLESDPELADAAKKSAAIESPAEIPIPLSKEAQVEAYKKAKRELLKRTLTWAGLIALVVLSFVGAALVVIFMLVSR